MMAGSYNRRGAALLAIVLLVGGLLAAGARAADGGRLDASEARAMAEAGAVTIVDIRRPGEWRQTGLPAGAERATIAYGRGQGDFLARIRELTGGRRDAPIALICAGGVRSAYAAELLRQRGFTKVYDISEGMLGSRAGPGWLKQDLPVERCGQC